MTAATTFGTLGQEQRSPFTATDVCREAGLTLPDSAARPTFDDDLWNFTAVVGLPVQMPLANRRFDFTAILDPRWQLVAKELILALTGPSPPRGGAAATGLPHAAAPKQLHRAAERTDPVLRLAWPTRCRDVGRP